MAASVCRVCLDSNVRMHSIEDRALLELFEILSSSKLNTEDRMPTKICYICISQLKRCREFSDMAKKSTRTLTHILDSGIQISPKNVTPSLGATHNLTKVALPHLDVKDFSKSRNSSIQIKPQKVPMKEETSDEDSMNTDESRLINNYTNSSRLDNNMDSNNLTEITQELALVKEEIPEEDLMGIKESRPCNDNINNSRLDMDVDMDSSSLADIMQEQALVKKETTEEDLIDIEECRLINDNMNSSRLLYVDTNSSNICKKCNKEFRQLVNFKRHMLTHKLSDGQFCHICNETFSNAENLKTHMLIHKEICNICKICNKSLSGIGNLRRHMLIHTEDKRYSCSVCKRDLTSGQSLKQHMLTHTGGGKVYSCDSCNKTFNRSDVLMIHILRCNSH